MKDISAFPTGIITDDKGMIIGGSNGMSLRDYFATNAMQGMLSACTGWSESDQERLAKCSYKMADAMIKARDK